MSEALDYFEAAVNQSSREFIKGFFVGQIFLMTLLIVLCKFLFFRGSEETRFYNKKRHINFDGKEYKKKAGALFLISDGDIAEKVGCPVDGETESCNWLNYLLAQVFERYRVSKSFHLLLLDRLDKVLNPDDSPVFMGQVSITEFEFGSSSPVFSNARVVSSSTIDRIRNEVEFSYVDQIKLGVETQLLINWPKEMTASLPVSFAVSQIAVSGTMALEFLTTDSLDTIVAFTLLDDFKLDLTISTTLGSKTKVNNLPKLESLIRSRIGSFFYDNLVQPNYMHFIFPYLYNEEESEGVRVSHFYSGDFLDRSKYANQTSSEILINSPINRKGA